MLSIRPNTVQLSAFRVALALSGNKVHGANVLVFANLDASLAAFKVPAQLGEAHVIGPVLLGTNHSVHPLQPSVDVHSLLTLGTLAVVEAQEHERRHQYHHVDSIAEHSSS